jgi:hypothetical protein
MLKGWKICSYVFNTCEKLLVWSLILCTLAIKYIIGKNFFSMIEKNSLILYPLMPYEICSNKSLLKYLINTNFSIEYEFFESRLEVFL